MPFAVTHVLLSIILVDIYRDYFAAHKHTLYKTIKYIDWVVFSRN